MFKPVRLNNYALSICVMDYSLIRFFSSLMSVLRTSLASAMIATSAIFIIVACGFLLMAIMKSASPNPAVCWMAPLMPKEKRIFGLMCLPACPTSAP